MTTDFSTLLDRTNESIEKPKSCPVGTYVLRVRKFEFGESSEKKTPGCTFFFGIESPGPDVDMAILASQKIDLSKKEIRHTFWLTEDSMYRLQEFCIKHLGIPAGPSTTLKMMLQLTPQKSVFAKLKQKPSTKEGDDSIYNEIESFAVHR